MKYLDYFESNKKEIMDRLKFLLEKYKVQPVGCGYIDCIVMENNLDAFVGELSTLGVLIEGASWWCYVNPNNHENSGCPHGMGGPVSEYYDGWFSELQNEMVALPQNFKQEVLHFYDKQLIENRNWGTLDEIKKRLLKPFKYTQTEFIPQNKCVTPALWLLVPADWRRS